MSVDRLQLRPLNSYWATVYVPTEEARGPLRVYSLVAGVDAEKLTYENVEVGQAAVVGGEVWLRTAEYDARELFSPHEDSIWRLVGKWPDDEGGWVLGFEWFLGQAEEAGSVAFASERAGRQPILVTRGLSNDDERDPYRGYCIWVPKVDELTEDHERLVTGFERARLAGDPEAIEKLHGALESFVRIMIEVTETGSFQMVGVQGARVLE